MANIPILYKYLKQKKSWGLPRPHFWLQRCQWHRSKRFWRLLKWFSSQIWCHMQNGFSLLINQGHIWGWKKLRVQNIVQLSR
jgi:hypothetical protein